MSEIGCIAGILGSRVEQLAAMDRNLVSSEFGLPGEWPEELFAKGTPVWVEIQGKPHFGVRPGVVDYVGAPPSHDAYDRRTLGINVDGFVSLGGDNTYYTLLHAFSFWPRSLEAED